jgi:hypothetical protein
MQQFQNLPPGTTAIQCMLCKQIFCESPASTHATYSEDRSFEPADQHRTGLASSPREAMLVLAAAVMLLLQVHLSHGSGISVALAPQPPPPPPADVATCPSAPSGFFVHPLHCIGDVAPTCSNELSTGGGCTVADCVVKAAAACAKDARWATRTRRHAHFIVTTLFALMRARARWPMPKNLL